MNNSFQFVNARPLIAIDPDGRDAVIIAYPDFKPEITDGWRPLALGHAGILLIDNKTGTTKYYEYGRYDKEKIGLTKNVKVSNVVIENGKPTEASLQKVLGELSKKSGHDGKIVGAYIKSNKFDDMQKYAENKIKESTDPKRKEYSVLTNNCATFAKDVAREDNSVPDPTIINPSPNNIVDEFIEEGAQKVEFTPSASTTTKHKSAPAHQPVNKPSPAKQKNNSQHTPSHTDRKNNKLPPLNHRKHQEGKKKAAI